MKQMHDCAAKYACNVNAFTLGYMGYMVVPQRSPYGTFGDGWEKMDRAKEVKSKQK